MLQLKISIHFIIFSQKTKNLILFTFSFINMYIILLFCYIFTFFLKQKNKIKKRIAYVTSFKHK
jgi:hypothetical protein